MQVVLVASQAMWEPNGWQSIGRCSKQCVPEQLCKLSIAWLAPLVLASLRLALTPKYGRGLMKEFVAKQNGFPRNLTKIYIVSTIFQYNCDSLY